jgi:hypothetical protein
MEKFETSIRSTPDNEDTLNSYGDELVKHACRSSSGAVGYPLFSKAFEKFRMSRNVRKVLELGNILQNVRSPLGSFPGFLGAPSLFTLTASYLFALHTISSLGWVRSPFHSYLCSLVVSSPCYLSLSLSLSLSTLRYCLTLLSPLCSCSITCM